MIYDLAIIGGGINGCGIAREAARRGLSVLLCEQDDLASGTSSASTKLIHGGLRYLEHYEFRLVREALREREVLWTMAPHLVRPMRFVLPHHAGLRSPLLLRAGLFLYDHIGGRGRLPGSRRLRLRQDPAGAPLRDEYRLAFEYSDCCVDDARLVVLTAMDAAQRGAVIRTRTRVAAAERDDDLWRLTLENRRTGARDSAAARALVNAAGAWLDRVGLKAETAGHAPVRLVQGSHIVTPRLFDHGRSYLFQNADGRVVFAIPYERDFTLIGTTDRDYAGDPASVSADAAEISYLCAAVSGYFTRPITPDEIVWTFSGVRSLYDDGASAAQEVTRDYVLALDAPVEKAALLSIYGGKITTFRQLALAALDRMAPHLPPRREPAHPKDERLPGGDFPTDGLPALATALRAGRPWLAEAHSERLARAYGTRAQALLAGAKDAADLVRHFGADLYEREAAYLITHEWAETAADILWRRSKLGLRLSPAEVAGLQDWMASHARREGVTHN